MKGKAEKKGLVKVNRMLTGILAAAVVMSNLSGTGLIVQAAELKMTLEESPEIGTEETASELSTEMEPEETTSKLSIEVETEEDAPELSTEIEMVEATTELFTEEEIEEMETELSTDAEGVTTQLFTEIDTEDITLEELTGEESLFASVYLQFNANGGNCDISMMELTPDNMQLMLPQPEKSGYRFNGWYMDQECTIAFDESNIFWEAGSTYVLYADYEAIEEEEITLIERTLQQSINGVTITVEGNMPKEATLAVRAEELTQNEQKNIIEESDIVTSADELDTEQSTSYSYDITICYQDMEYEPYLFDEMMQVTFSFADEQELKDAMQMEVFHIDDNENVEKIQIKEASESEVSFDADAFSTYILITKVEYIGNKNWAYGFTGGVQTFTAPVSGQYVFECYGAGTDNSKGSFAKGTVGLKKNETVYIYVGGVNNSFNGAGKGGAVWYSASNTEGSFSQYIYSDAGCGATDVRVGTGLNGRMIVAGGGAGDGHEGGVWYSYNGKKVSGGPDYNTIAATNAVNSNGILGIGTDYNTSVTEGVWGSGSYPNRGTYAHMAVYGGGGGGYYGGQAGYAGTSNVIPTVSYNNQQYNTVNSVVENLVYTGNGKCLVSLYSLEADVITYYNYNMTKLGEVAGLTGSKVSFPQLSAQPSRASDSMYDYTYMGWDDMATDEVEYYTDAETVAMALQGDKNFIAAYHCVGKSYTVTLDCADAQMAGTTSIVATYHEQLPNITIPAKEGAIFAGYYSGLNGTGEQIYSAEGKGVVLSAFGQDSTIYAHWVQPITNISNPESKEVIAGYAGVILTTEVELSQENGYVLSYQWYMNQENSNIGGTLIEAADSRKLVIPQGFQPGEYYFYCLVTATSVLNGQSVSMSTTPAVLSVEKGTIGMEQVELENENIIYDGTPKALKAAINNSNPYTIYYGIEPLDSENYLTKGSTEPNSYLDAGTYTNYIYVTGTDFTDFSGSIAMTIQKAEPYVYLSGKNTAYNGLNQTINSAHIYGVDEKEMSIAAAYVYFIDEDCTRKTDASCGALEEGGAPSAVGTYYVHAVTEETVNYKAVATKVPAMFNILGTNVKYSISGYHGIYDGKPHGLQITNEDEVNAVIYFSEGVELTKDNYMNEGTTVPYEYTEVGNYSVYYLVVTKLAGGIDQYESGVAQIIIEAAKVTPDHSNSGNNGTNAEDGNGTGNNDATNGNSGNKNDNDNDNHNSGGSSSGSGNAGQTGTEKPHVHNYELISFDSPTATQEGKALYRCKECGHELVIAYPVLEDGNVENSESVPDMDEKEIGTNDSVEGKKDNQEEKDKNKTNKVEVNQKEDFKNLVNSEEITEKETKKELTESELYKIAQALEELTEAQVKDLYKSGLLNMTQEEFERLLSILHTQIIIHEEEVGLSENTPLADEGEEAQVTTKQSEPIWNLLWAFLLGAAVMYLIRKIMETRNTKKPKQTSSQTRKLN